MKVKRSELSTEHLKQVAINILEGEVYTKVNGSECAEVVRRPERIFLKHGPKFGLSEKIKQSIKKLS